MLGPSSRGSSIGRLIDYLKRSSYTTLLIGHFVCQELGIPVSVEGMRQGDMGKYLTLEGFRSDPWGAWNYYKGIVQRALELRDHPFYTCIHRLVDAGYIKSIITVCVDGALARVKNVIQVYGDLLKCRCMSCGRLYDTRKFIQSGKFICPYDKAPLKPMITLYGESIPEREWIRAVVETGCSELLIVLGLDPCEAPINMLPVLAKYHGVKVVVVEYEGSHIGYCADHHIVSDPIRMFIDICGELV